MLVFCSRSGVAREGGKVDKLRQLGQMKLDAVRFVALGTANRRADGDIALPPRAPQMCSLLLETVSDTN